MRHRMSFARAWRSCRLIPAALLALLSAAPLSAQPAAAQVSTGKTIAVQFTNWIDVVWARHLLARAETMKDNPMMAEAFLRDALRVDPGSPVLVENLATFYRQAGVFPLDLAVAAYGRLLDPGRNAWVGFESPSPVEEDVADGRAVYAEAKKLFDQGDFLGAELLLRGRLAQAPDDLQALRDLGVLYARTKDWGMSAVILAYALDLYPDDVDVADGLCFALDRAGRPDVVMEILLSFLNKQPENPGLLSQAAVRSLVLGRTNDAHRYATRWHEVAPGDTNALQFLSRISMGGVKEEKP